MANLTIVIDDQLLQDARVKALREGTSVNEICREAIARFAQTDAQARQRAQELLAIADRALGPAGTAWSGREALYEEVLAERVPATRKARRAGPRGSR